MILEYVKVSLFEIMEENLLLFIEMHLHLQQPFYGGLKKAA